MYVYIYYAAARSASTPCKTLSPFVIFSHIHQCMLGIVYTIILPCSLFLLHYVLGMLTNLESLPLQRIHNMRNAYAICYIF